MALYAGTGRRRDPDVTRKGARFLLGLGDFLMHWFMWVISPVERLALRLHATPDLFNLLGLIFGLVSGLLVASGELPLAGWAILVGGVCDILDGRVARATGVDSAYGKFIDSTLDRFAEVFLFLGSAYFLRLAPLGSVIVVAALAGSLLTSYARARGESLGVTCREGLMQRPERLVLIGLACLTDTAFGEWRGKPQGTLLCWVMILLAVAGMMTAIYRTVWISRQLRRSST